MNSHHLKTPAASLQDLGTDPERGLTQAEASARLAVSGPNDLTEVGPSIFAHRVGRNGIPPPSSALFTLLGAQLADGLFLLLLGAALTASLLGEWMTGLAFTVASLLYLLPGWITAHCSRPSIAALKKLLPAGAHVLRDAQWRDIPARDLVPGDILQVEAGEVLPADVRFIEAVNLRIQEGAFTGAAEPAGKQAEALSGGDLPLQERLNLSFMGALVTQGRGLALVTGTGMQTELGQVAASVQREPGRRPAFHSWTDPLRRSILILAAALALWIVIPGLMARVDLRLLLQEGLRLAAALSPAALPAVIALALLLGARRMKAHNVHVRGLPAVDTLGSVTDILVHKAGTLTENRMTVVVLDVAGHAFDLTGDMDRSGSFTAVRGPGVPAQSALSLTAIAGALCSDARLIDLDDDRFHTLGDPTEGALVTAAARLGYWKSSLDTSFPRTAELPFDPDRKRMTTIHDLSAYDPTILAGLEIGIYRYIAFTKGSVDGLLELCSHIWVDGAPVEMDAELKARIEASADRLSKKGMRVLGVAFRLLDQIPGLLQTDLEQNLTFLGLFGMVDPARPEVPAAVALSRSAGIRTLMLTTDQPLAAAEIARQLGLMDPQATRPALKKVLTGDEIDALPREELERTLEEVQVLVRLSPAQKLKVLGALQSRGRRVALTGVEVMDAPGLRQADVGAALGTAGTDIAREAADLVLLDDNFASLIGAIEEGRAVSSNLRLFLRLLTAGLVARAVVLLAVPFLPSLPALTPLHFLVLSLLVDGPLGIGLVTRKAADGAMQAPPPSASARPLIASAWMGALIGLLALGGAAWAASDRSGALFFFLGLAQVAYAWLLPVQSHRSA